MSTPKYRPQLTLEEIQDMCEAIKHSVENGNTNVRLPSLYNKLDMFIHKCKLGMNKATVVRSTHSPSPMASPTQSVPARDTSASESASESANAQSAQSAQDTLAAAYSKYQMFEGREDKLSEEELECVAAYKINNRMEMTTVEMQRAESYLMKTL